MAELPADAVPTRRTRSFTADTVPAGLLRDHRTRAGVWGRIVVEHGQLRYTSEGVDLVLGADEAVVTGPQETHAVGPSGRCASTCSSTSGPRAMPRVRTRRFEATRVSPAASPREESPSSTGQGAG